MSGPIDFKSGKKKMLALCVIAAKSLARLKLEGLQKKHAKELVDRAVAPAVKKAKIDMSSATTSAHTKDFSTADALLKQVLKTLDAMPRTHREHDDVISIRQVLVEQKKKISGRLQKQRARIEKEEKEAASLLQRCGTTPLRSAWDGEVKTVTRHLERTAHDPDSIEVDNCTTPTLTKQHCWLTTCEVRGKNAFGAKVFSRVLYSIGKHPSVEGYGQVLSSETL